MQRQRQRHRQRQTECRFCPTLHTDTALYAAKADYLDHNEVKSLLVSAEASCFSFNAWILDLKSSKGMTSPFSSGQLLIQFFRLREMAALAPRCSRMLSPICSWSCAVCALSSSARCSLRWACLGEASSGEGEGEGEGVGPFNTRGSVEWTWTVR